MDLFLTIVDGKDLVSRDGNGLSDPYIKAEIRLISNNQMVEGTRR